MKNFYSFIKDCSCANQNLARFWDKWHNYYINNADCAYSRDKRSDQESHSTYEPNIFIARGWPHRFGFLARLDYLLLHHDFIEGAIEITSLHGKIPIATFIVDTKSTHPYSSDGLLVALPVFNVNGAIASILFVVKWFTGSISSCYCSLSCSSHGETELNLIQECTICDGFIGRDHLEILCKKSANILVHSSYSSEYYKRLNLVAARLPSLGHQFINVFSGVLDVLLFARQLRYSNANLADSWDLLSNIYVSYSAMTNFFPIQALSTAFGVAHSTYYLDESSISQTMHAAMLPDALIPAYDSGIYLSRWFGISANENKRRLEKNILCQNRRNELIIIQIKGSGSYSTQQVSKVDLLALLPAYVEEILAAIPDSVIVIDGCTSPHPNLDSGYCNNCDQGPPALSLFRQKEMAIFTSTMKSIACHYKNRVTSIIGATLEDKWPYYVRTGAVFCIGVGSTYFVPLVANPDCKLFWKVAVKPELGSPFLPRWLNDRIIFVGEEGRKLPVPSEVARCIADYLSNRK